MRAAHEDAVGDGGDRAGKAIDDEGDVMLRLQPEPCLRVAGVRLVAAGAVDEVELEGMAGCGRFGEADRDALALAVGCRRAAAVQEREVGEGRAWSAAVSSTISIANPVAPMQQV